MKYQRTFCLMFGFILYTVSSKCEGDIIASNNTSIGSMEVAYVGTSNDMFNVCSFDRTNGVLLRWKGILVSRSQLPVAGALRDHLIFEVGERPKMEHIDPKDPAAWKPPYPGWWHKYGPIPYPIKDIDPPLTSCWQKDGRIALGFRGVWRFFVLEAIDGNRELSGRKHTPLERDVYEIVPIATPPHRKEEVKNLMSGKVEVEVNK